MAGKDPQTAVPAELPQWLRRTMQIMGAGFILIGAPLAHFHSGVQGGGPMLLGAGVAAFLFASLDRLESFSAWGVSAKLREARKAADEARASAAEVRALALSLARLALGLAKGANRVGPMVPMQLLARAEATRILSTVDATPDERREVFKEWGQYTMHDAVHAVTSALWQAVPPEARPAVEERRKLRGNAFGHLASLPTAAELRALAVELGGLNAEVEKTLQQLTAAEAAVARGEVPELPSA